jgi:hypothetical protein
VLILEEDKEIRVVAQELRQGDPLLAFKPKDVDTKFFIGEAVIIAAATILVGGLIKGINETLEERGKELGKTITNWIIDKIEGLFKKPQEAQTEQKEVEKEMHELSKSASKMDKKTIDARLDESEKQMAAWLEKQGILHKKAIEIARKSRAAAQSEILKASTYGTK